MPYTLPPNSTKLDPAILRSLNLPQDTKVSISSHGGSGFSNTFRIRASIPSSTSTSSSEEEKENGETQKSFFLKRSSAPGAEAMFKGEHLSLNALATTDSSLRLCPMSLGHGACEEKTGEFFLATEFLELGSSISRNKNDNGTGLSLSSKLARLHSVPAPVPTGYETAQFGFEVPTCCGDTEQDNSWRSSWADFYAENRLKCVLSKTRSADKELKSLVQRTADEVVPALLADGHLTQGDGSPIQPVVVHGDLWSGNHGKGIIGGVGGVENVVFDPSVCYAHSEFELGIMRMFGFEVGFSLEEYLGEIKGGKCKPEEEFEDRGRLYELYHHLNHNAMFGGGYRSGAVAIMNDLLKKYGKE